jgi:hypothetical protein
MQESCSADEFQPKEEVISVLRDAEAHDIASLPAEPIRKTSRPRKER